MNQAFFTALFDPELPPPAGLTTWNGSDPALRFGVYRNNVIVSLIDALADTYPVTLTLVGEEFFRAMARLFVQHELPRSKVLAFYGESFPAFIEAFPPTESVPYLADVARLEMRRVRAYHAAEATPLAADAMVQAMDNPDQLPQLRMTFQPSVGLVRSPYAVVSLWAAHQDILDIATIDPYCAENALILRPNLDVDVIALQPGAADFIAHLLQGDCLGKALEVANTTSDDFDPAETLAMLIQTQAVSTLYITQS